VCEVYYISVVLRWNRAQSALILSAVVVAVVVVEVVVDMVNINDGGRGPTICWLITKI